MQGQLKAGSPDLYPFGIFDEERPKAPDTVHTIEDGFPDTSDDFVQFPPRSAV